MCWQVWGVFVQWFRDRLLTNSSHKEVKSTTLLSGVHNDSLGERQTKWILTEERRRRADWAYWGLRARISLFALVWAGHEQAREERCVAGLKGWVDTMCKARSGESKTRGTKMQLGEREKRQRSTCQRNDCSELAVLQAVASLCGGIHVFTILHLQTLCKLKFYFAINWKSHQRGPVMHEEQRSGHIN